MNEPNIPDDTRGWDAIDIFLFSNGQQYSPPRKYHLLSDDLKCWHQTKTFLARSQYGSMHSAIDLYSLDGKKIEGPLELKNAAAYVVVKPPDAFIPAGYEKYLIKASRSWEKRQEKLLNSNEIDGTGKTEMYLDITTIEQIEGIVSMKMAENSTSDTADISVQPQKMVESPTFPKSNITKTEKLYPKKKSNDSEGSAICKKKYFCPSRKNNENNFMKTKNAPFKPQKRCTKQQAITSKYSQNSNTPTRGNSIQYKANSRTSNLRNSEILNDAKYNSKIPNNTNHINEKLKKISNKELPPISNVYRNNENDLQSILLETDLKTTVVNSDTKTSLEISKGNKHMIEEQTQNNIVSIDNNKGKLNIQLRIKLEDFTSPMTSENHLTTDRSVITLIKKEMASQVNIDVILGKDIFTCNNRLLLNKKSIESNAEKDENHILNDDEIFVHCSCANFNSKLSVLNDSRYKNALEFPPETNEILESCCNCKSNQKEIEMVHKKIQKSVSRCSSVILSSTKVNTEKSENITNQEDSTENKSKYQTDFVNDDIIKAAEVPMISKKVFIDKFVQTESCNVMLQAKRHEDGRYTFHLPALSLLKQYNLSQM